MDELAELDEIDARLFALLEGVWTEEEKQQALDFYNVGESDITSLYAFDALCKYHVPIPKDLGKILYEVLEFAELDGEPEYEALNKD